MFTFNRLSNNNPMAQIWHKRKDWLLDGLRPVAHLILGAGFKLRVTGWEHVPATGPVLMLPKHQRWEDIPLLAMASPRPLYYLAKYELFRFDFVKRLLMCMGGIPINRQKPMESRVQLRKLSRLIGEGEGVVVFPEGTYYPHRIGPGHVGMIRFIISRFQMPVVPVGIHYQKSGARTTVRIHFGEAQYAYPTPVTRAWVQSVMHRIALLSGLPEQDQEKNGAVAAQTPKEGDEDQAVAGAENCSLHAACRH